MKLLLSFLRFIMNLSNTATFWLFLILSAIVYPIVTYFFSDLGLIGSIAVGVLVTLATIPVLIAIRKNNMNFTVWLLFALTTLTFKVIWLSGVIWLINMIYVIFKPKGEQDA